MDRSNRPAGPIGDVPETIVSEWLKVLAACLGLGATPVLASNPVLLQRLPWLGNYFWIAGLVFGVLLAGMGVFLALRQREQAPPTPTGPARRVLGVEILRTLKVTLAVEGSPALLPTAGLTLASQAAAARASSAPASASAPGARRLVQALAQAWPYLPSFTIAMGVFVLLPAVIALLAQTQNLENPARIATFFSAPVLLLWITAEAVHFAHSSQSGLTGLPRLLGMLAPAVQALSAVILWIFLGLSLGLQGVEWLFWVGAGLALLGAVLATAAAVLGNRRLEP